MFVWMEGDSRAVPRSAIRRLLLRPQRRAPIRIPKPQRIRCVCCLQTIRWWRTCSSGRLHLSDRLAPRPGMRGPDWDEPMDEDKADRLYAVAAVVVHGLVPVGAD